ncbi:MAG: U-box domain-containing protein [Chlamydiota bacterium]
MANPVQATIDNFERNFVDPITQEIMHDPVIAEDGMTYENEAIRGWFRGHNTSPLTRRVLANLHLTPNNLLHTIIGEWAQLRLMLQPLVVPPPRPLEPRPRVVRQPEVIVQVPVIRQAVRPLPRPVVAVPHGMVDRFERFIHREINLDRRRRWIHFVQRVGHRSLALVGNIAKEAVSYPQNRALRVFQVAGASVLTGFLMGRCGVLGEKTLRMGWYIIGMIPVVTLVCMHDKFPGSLEAGSILGGMLAGSHVFGTNSKMLTPERVAGVLLSAAFGVAGTYTCKLAMFSVQKTGRVFSEIINRMHRPVAS